MSFQALNWAMKVQAGGPGPKCLLIVLASFADEEGSCFPGQELLAELTEQGVRTVQRQLVQLEERGLLRKENRGRAGGGRTSNRYFLQMGANPPSATGKPATGDKQTRHLRQANPPPVAGESSVEPSVVEPPEEKADGTSAAPDGGLFDAPKPPAKKPGREPDPVNVQAKALADHWATLTNGMANFLAARGVAVKALRAGHAPAAVTTAMDALYAARVPLTATALDIELRGGIRSGASTNGHKAYQDSDYWSTT